jgi:hypothetical protein
MSKPAPTLADLVAQVESDSYPDAIRFEPGTFAEPDTSWAMRPGVIAAITQANHCSHDTARMIAATSWGSWQLMGFNIYHPDSPVNKCPIAQYLNMPSLQRKSFDWLAGTFKSQYLFSDMSDPDKRADFAFQWNGPGNITEYAARLAMAYNALKVG